MAQINIQPEIIKAVVNQNNNVEFMQDNHIRASSVEQIEVCTTDTRQTKTLKDDSLMPMPETSDSNNIIPSDVKRINDERKPLAMEEIVSNEELIIQASSQQPSTSMSSIIACSNSDSVIQEVQIEKPSTHDKSSDLSFGEKFTPRQLDEQSNVLPVILYAQLNSLQSTQEYTLTQCSSASIPTTIREPSPSSLEGLLSQEWSEEDMLVSPSTHEKSPDLSFGEQLGGPARTSHTT